MAFVYDLPTLQLMLQLLIDHMISQLEVWVHVCIPAVFLPSVLITFSLLICEHE